MTRSLRQHASSFAVIHALLFAAVLGSGSAARLHAQDVSITLGVNAADRTRIAAANFKPAGDAESGALRSTFDRVLFSDLSNAGIFDVVSKSMIPQATPGSQAEMHLGDWSAPPSGASMVAFGSLGLNAGKLQVTGFLDDTKNTVNPQVFARQYTGDANDEGARLIAHRFADEIILRLGGGINGIAETKIYYVHLGGGNKEIWEMDYDGANQHPVTHLGTIALSPRVSPDNSNLAFSSLGKNGFQIQIYSLLLGHMITFPISPGNNLSPAWSPNGNEIAYSSSRTGDPEIWIADSHGGSNRRLTSFAGPDVSPVFNPRTGAQIAWISGRSGLPQLYIMSTDGSGVTRLTDQGYATSPSWSPNGQFIAFAWNRKYGPGAPGGQDIYVMDVSSLKWIQLTHDGGPCDFPSWSPDGRHIVYAKSPHGRMAEMKIWTMLADGTQQHELTGNGSDMPNWSWK